MLGWLFILFTVVPIVDLLVLIEIGGHIGALPSIALVLLTGAAGAWLAKTQGLSVFRRFNEALATGRLPGTELVEGLLVFAGGALLVTPGVVTDVAGVLLLLPPIRRVAAKVLLAVFSRRLTTHVVEIGGAGAHAHVSRMPSPWAAGDGPVIDVVPEKPAANEDER